MIFFIKFVFNETLRLLNLALANVGKIYAKAIKLSMGLSFFEVIT